MRCSRWIPAVALLAFLPAALPGCSLFSTSMRFLLTRDGDQPARKASNSLLKPLRPAQDAVELEVFFVERSRTDPLLGEMLWKNLAPIGEMPAETRQRLFESGFRAGHSASAPPPALETLLQLRSEISDDALPADQKNLIRRTIPLPSGSDTEIQTSPNYPLLELPPSAGAEEKRFENARCLFRVQATRRQDGWATLEFQPEIHHGQYGWRPMAVENGLTSEFAGRTTQQIHPLFRHRFSVSLNRGEMVVLSADTAETGSLGALFFRGPDDAAHLQRLLVIRLADLPRIRGTRVE